MATNKLTPSQIIAELVKCLPQWKRDALMAVSDNLIQDIVADSRRSPTLNSPSMYKDEPSNAPSQPAYHGKILPDDFWKAKAEGRAEEWLRPKAPMSAGSGSGALDRMFPTTFEIEAGRKARAEAEAKQKEAGSNAAD